MTIQQLVAREQRRLISEKAILERKIMKLPQQSLYFVRNRCAGKDYFKWYVADNRAGRRGKRVYLQRRERPLARKLARRTLMQARLKDIDRELSALDAYLSKHTDSSFYKKLLQSPGLQELIDEDMAQASPEMAEELDKWMHDQYETNPAHPEQKNIETSQGIMVRFKSEAIILMLLTIFHIPFRYECRLDVAGYTYYPDFTIRHPVTGEFYYWEHVGLLNSSNYRLDFINKLRNYINNGILPDNNLILTFESEGHPLDISIALDKLKEFFFCDKRDINDVIVLD